MSRTILVHLNVTVPDAELRPHSPDEIADVLLAAIEVGSDSDEYRTLGISELVCPLAEEV